MLKYQAVYEQHRVATFLLLSETYIDNHFELQSEAGW